MRAPARAPGLGHDFLRHVDRCRLLVHVVDVSGSEGRDPVEDFDAINAELKQYSPDLAERPQIVAANKVDILPRTPTTWSGSGLMWRLWATRSWRFPQPLTRAPGNW